jgi:hypothetical protein
MGVIKGKTQHRLDLVKSYDPANPYIVGVNGVTAVNYDPTTGDIESVEYTIGSINYVTKFEGVIRYGPATQAFFSGTTKTPNLNQLGSTVSYKPPVKLFGSRQLLKEEPYPTTFEYTTSTKTENDYFVFKDDVKMGVVFTPKVQEEIFIERQVITVFEKHARLSEVVSLDDLVEYRNGFYNVRNLE